MPEEAGKELFPDAGRGIDLVMRAVIGKIEAVAADEIQAAKQMRRIRTVWAGLPGVARVKVSVGCETLPSRTAG